MPARSPGTFRLLTRPTMWLLHVPAAAATVAAIMLGNWQVASWEEDRQDKAAELAEADPLPIAEVMGPDDPFPDGAGQPVTVPGTWAPEETVYVRDKEYDGESGYWVVTPLLTCGSTTDDCAEPVSMPVALGWTASVDDVVAPQGTVEVTGWLQPGDGPGAADDDPTDDVLSSLRIAELLQRSDRDLYGAYVMLDEPTEARFGEPLTPERLPEPDSFTALRNLLYGVEWYLFAGFAVFLWWRWSRDEVERARRQAEVTEHEDASGVNPVSDPAGAARESAEPRIPSQP
jgi:surfeit locus 1 family protein